MSISAGADKQPKQKAILVTVETFDPLNSKVRIDSPRSVQAAFNMGISIEELYVPPEDQLAKLMQGYMIELINRLDFGTLIVCLQGEL
jgi:hypothetical protein